MKKVWLIVCREIGVRLRKPSFWVVTLLVPVILAALYALPVVAASRSAEPANVLVVDETGLFASGLVSTPVVHFQEMPSIEYARSNSEKGDLILLIPRRETAMPREATLYHQGLRLPSLAVQSVVDNQLQQLLRNAILEDVYGLSPAERHSVESSHILLHTRDMVSGREGFTRVKTIAAIVLAALMALAIILFSVQVMRAVQEERQNRIAEVMATSVRPLQLMGGKVAGVAVTALIQLLLWGTLTAVAIAAIQAAAPDLFHAAAQLPQAVDSKGVAATMQYAAGTDANSTVALVDDTVRGLTAIDMSLIAGMFVLCFLLGFLLYGGLLAALAARLDSEADALQWTLALCWPLLLVPMMVPLIARGSVVLLFIPFTAPAAFMAALPFGIALGPALVSLLLLLLFAAGALLLAAAAYRTYGASTIRR